MATDEPNELAESIRDNFFEFKQEEVTEQQIKEHWTRISARLKEDGEENSEKPE